MIVVEALKKSHGPTPILRGVSFELPSHAVAAVVGPSGGGKTTLLRCMHGLAHFDEGRVKIGDAELKAGPLGPQKKALDAVRLRAGFVFQTWHLFAHMTVLENVIEAPVHVRHVPRAQAIGKAEALLEKVGLAHRKDALPKALSGGEQQRAAIARALAMEPEVLFMDEPTSALDPQRVVALAELLSTLREEGLSLVAVTHDIDFAERLADRVLVLVGGELVEDGAPAQVLHEPKDERTAKFLAR